MSQLQPCAAPPVAGARSGRGEDLDTMEHAGSKHVENALTAAASGSSTDSVRQRRRVGVSQASAALSGDIRADPVPLDGCMMHDVEHRHTITPVSP